MENTFQIYNKNLVQPSDVLKIVHMLPFERLTGEGWSFGMYFRAGRGLMGWEPKPSEYYENNPAWVVGTREEHLEEAGLGLNGEKSVHLRYNNDYAVLRPNSNFSVNVGNRVLHASTDGLLGISIRDWEGFGDVRNEKKFEFADIGEFKSRVAELSLDDLLIRKKVSVVGLFDGCIDISDEEREIFSEVDLHSDAEHVSVMYKDADKDSYLNFRTLLYERLPMLVERFNKPSRGGTAVCTVEATSPDGALKGSLMTVTTSYGFRIFPQLSNEGYERNTRRWKPLEKEMQVMTFLEASAIQKVMEAMKYEPDCKDYATIVANHKKIREELLKQIGPFL